MARRCNRGQSELLPIADGGSAAVYLLHDPPLSLFSEAYGATVGLTGAAAPQLTIVVPASVTGPEQIYEFERVAAGQAPPG